LAACSIFLVDKGFRVVDGRVLSVPGWIIERMSEAARTDPGPVGTRRLAAVDGSPAGLTVARVQAFLALLAGPMAAVDGADAVDCISALERLKNAASAAQARLTVSLLAEQSRQDGPRGVDPAATIRSVGAQVGLARSQSPHQGSRFVRAAQILSTDMPATMAVLSSGRIGEYRASLAVAGTSFLAPADRRLLDTELGPLLEGLSDRETQVTAARIGYRLDPGAALAQHSAAEAARRVTLRPAPDTMAILSALLPARAGIAIYTILTAAAATARAAGDLRSGGQVMADTLLARVTGTEHPDDVPVGVQLIVDETTITGGPVPGHLAGYGPLPAPVTRTLAATAPQRLVPTRGGHIITTDRHPKHRSAAGSPTSTDTGTGSTAHPDSPTTSRRFTAAQRDLLQLRDQHCRTPYCDAPIRHHDHITPHHTGGPTNIGNGQGLCEACNYRKEHPDWHTTVTNTGEDGRPHTTQITTPTGHTYRSTAPPPLGTGAKTPTGPDP
jgi:uncharacterized protein DUF222/HNH endonuclease